MSIEDTVDEAVEWVCEQNLLEGYIREQKAEVKMDLLTEYDEEACIRGWRRDGILIGRQEKAIETAKNMLKKKYPESDISEITGLSLNQVNELKKQISAHA